jgi:small subunit ribosomal protein S13
MARIAGIDLPNQKPLEYGLTALYGIGMTIAGEICDKLKIDRRKLVGDLTEEEVAKIRRLIEEDYTVEGALRTEISLSVKRLQEIGCYRGMRHRKGLPVRGQRTKTNARTRKGPRKTVANKKK